MADNLLSANERVKIRTYNSVGLTNEEIAEKVGITVRDVEIEIQRQGLKTHTKESPQPHAFAKPKPVENLKAEDSKEDKPRQTPGLWSGELGERLKDLYVNQGKPVAEIAFILGLTKKQVSQGVYNQKKKWGLAGANEPVEVNSTPTAEPVKKKPATINEDFENAVKPMFDSVKKIKVPQSVIELAKEELDSLNDEFVAINSQYNTYVSLITELKTFIKECEN